MLTEPAVEVSSRDPTDVIQNNFITTLNLLRFSKKNKSKIIFLSSSRIYPIKKSYEFFNLKNKKLYTEKTSTDGAKTIYGFQNLHRKNLLKNFLMPIKWNLLLIGCLTSGPWQFGKVEQGLVSLWLWKHLNKQSLNYIGFRGSGQQIRDVLDIDDLCELIYLQINKINKIYNQTFCVGGGKKNFFNLKLLTRLCEKITNNHIKIYKIKKTSLYDIPYYISSNAKLFKYYNWKTSSNLNEHF